MAECSRIEFLVARDGLPLAIRWVRRTIWIYGRAVLTKRHFAHCSRYRHWFIAAYLEFKRWSRTAPVA